MNPILGSPSSFQRRREHRRHLPGKKLMLLAALGHEIRVHTPLTSRFEVTITMARNKKQQSFAHANFRHGGILCTEMPAANGGGVTFFEAAENAVDVLNQALGRS